MANIAILTGNSLTAQRLDETLSAAGHVCTRHVADPESIDLTPFDLVVSTYWNVVDVWKAAQVLVNASIAGKPLIVCGITSGVTSGTGKNHLGALMGLGTSEGQGGGAAYSNVQPNATGAAHPILTGYTSGTNYLALGNSASDFACGLFGPVGTTLAINTSANVNGSGVVVAIESGTSTLTGWKTGNRIVYLSFLYNAATDYSANGDIFIQRSATWALAGVASTGPSDVTTQTLHTYAVVDTPPAAVVAETLHNYVVLTPPQTGPSADTLRGYAVVMPPQDAVSVETFRTYAVLQTAPTDLTVAALRAYVVLQGEQPMFYIDGDQLKVRDPTPGTHRVAIKATDDTGLERTKNFYITVEPYAQPDYMLVYSLTFDELDSNGGNQLERQGGGPLVSPEGFLGDGTSARYKLSAMPSWLASTDSVSMHAYVTVHRERKNATRDIVLYLGTDDVSAHPKMELAIIDDAAGANTTQPNLVLRVKSGVSTINTRYLGRANWNYALRWPEEFLSSGSKTVRPTGLLFLSGDEAIVIGHYEQTESVALRVDLDSGAVLGSFTFGAGTNGWIHSIARRANGDVWVLDRKTHKAMRIDLDASFASGTVSVLSTWDLSNIVSLLNGSVRSIEFGSVVNQEHIFVAINDTTPYLYCVHTNHLANATFDPANRFRRWVIPVNCQSLTIRPSDGQLYMVHNGTAAPWGGPIYRYASSQFTTLADGGTLVSNYTLYAPSGYPKAIKFHPATGEAWVATNGRAAELDNLGYLGFWRSTLLDEPVEKRVVVDFDGSGEYKIYLDGRYFNNLLLASNVTPTCLTIGGPPSASAGWTAGYAGCTVREVAFKRAPFTEAELEALASGGYEPHSLTVTSAALTNPGAESGTTGWTNETGAIGVRSTTPVPRLKSSVNTQYFFGGNVVQSIASQRVSLETVTGLPAASIDAAIAAGDLWVVLTWWQTNFNGTADPGGMGLRLLNGTPTEMSVTYSTLVANSDQIWRKRSLVVSPASGARNVDALLRSDRTSGTANDTYIDDVELSVYVRQAVLSEPGTFSAGMWSLAPTGESGKLAVTVTQLPTSGGTAITAIEYRIDGGSWVGLGGATTGVYQISGLVDGVSVNVELRAVNVVGSGPASDVKSATPLPFPVDLYWDNVVALWHFNGSDGSTAFVDSTGRHTVTRVGGPQISTAQSKFNGSSLRLPGTASTRSNYLLTDSSADFSWDSDFTVEAWLYIVSRPGPFTNWLSTPGSDATSGGFQWLITSTVWTPYFYDGGYLNIVGPAWALGTWTHVVVERQGGTLRFYVDGVPVGTTATSSIAFGRNQLEIGAGHTAGDNADWDGYMAELRITKGVARYGGSSFSVPTAPYPEAGPDAALPDQFESADWDVTDTGQGGEIKITISALPESPGVELSDLQYVIDGGSWTSLGGTTVGAYRVSGLADGVAVSVAIRAVNAVGPGTASATKPVTPTTIVYPLVTEYETAEELTHDWTDLTDWTVSNVQVSSNRLYGTTGTNPTAAFRAFSVASGGVAKVTAEIFRVTGVARAQYVGFDFNGGVAASLPNFIGIGVGASTDRPYVFIGSNFTGVTTGSIELSTTAVTGAVRAICVIDDENISLVLRKTDGSAEWKHVIPRSAAPNSAAATAFGVWNSDDRGTSGSYIKAIGAKKSLTPFRTQSNAAGTIEGNTGLVLYRDTSDLWRVHLPAGLSGTTPAPVCIYFPQASTGVAGTPVDEARALNVDQALDAAGYIVLSASDNGDQWGNQQSLDNFKTLLDWVRARVHCGSVVLLGVSGGAMTAWNAILRGDIDEAVAVAGICPVTDLDDLEANPTFTSSVRAAYGAADNAQYVTNSVGYDPNDEIDFSAFAGKGVKFYVAASGDTTVPNAVHVDVFKPKIEPHAAVVTISAAGTGHLTVEQYQGTDLVTFFNTFV